MPFKNLINQTFHTIAYKICHPEFISGSLIITRDSETSSE